MIGFSQIDLQHVYECQSCAMFCVKMWPSFTIAKSLPWTRAFWFVRSEPARFHHSSKTPAHCDIHNSQSILFSLAGMDMVADSLTI